MYMCSQDVMLAAACTGAVACLQAACPPCFGDVLILRVYVDDMACCRVCQCGMVELVAWLSLQLSWQMGVR